MAEVELENMQLKFRDVGDGPLIIIFHGFGGHPSNVREVADELAKNHRVVVPYLSPLYRAMIPLTFSQQVRIMKKFISHINPYRESFHILGTSYGGTLSVGVRRELSSLVLSHTLVNPMPFDPLKEIRNPYIRTMFLLSEIPFGLQLLFRSHFGGRTLRQLGKIFHMGLAGKKRIQKFDRRKYKLIKRALDRFLWIGKNEEWASWKKEMNDLVPTTIIIGSHDRVFSEKDYRSYEVFFKNVEVNTIPNSGHLLVKWRPKKVYELVKKTVERSECIDAVTKREMKISIARGKLKLRTDRVS